MKILKKIIFSLILTIIGMVSLNGICAIGEWFAYGAFYEQDRPKGLYLHKEGSRPKLKPNAELNGWMYKIAINSLGFRGGEVLSPKPQNGLRIWCIGGSTTFDIYASSNETTWPMVLQKHVQEAFPDRTVEVINAGIPGEILRGSLSDFQSYQQQIRPDYVVIYHGPNDMREVLAPPPNAPGAQPTKPPDEGFIHEILGRQEYALFRVIKRTIAPLRPLQKEWESNRMSTNQLGDLRNRNQQFVRFAQQSRVVPVIATHALRAQNGDEGEVARKRVAETSQLLRMYPKQAIEAFEEYNKMLASLAKSNNLPFADVRSVISADSSFWGDATHFRDAGSALAGETIAKTIISHLQRN